MPYPDFNPVALDLGFVKIHWYGIMYLIGFAGAWWLARWRALRPNSGWQPHEISDLLFYCALGVVLGGRIGYMLFYNFPTLIDDPLSLFRVWEGGMAFHGGLIGVIVAMALFARHSQRRFFQVADFVAPVVPIGLGTGRIGNFINGELWGRVTDAPWGMVFPQDPLQAVRHPSQLYQALTEGLLLFLIVFLYSSRPRPAMAVSGLFLLMYGTFRFLTEFLREPDAHIGFIALGWLTMGQLLSVPMVILGIILMISAYVITRDDRISANEK